MVSSNVDRIDSIETYRVKRMCMVEDEHRLIDDFK